MWLTMGHSQILLRGPVEGSPVEGVTTVLEAIVWRMHK